MAASSSTISTEPPVFVAAGCRVKTAASDIDGLPYQGEFKIEGGAPARLAIHSDLPCMLLDDPVSHRQSQARSSRLAFPRRVLGGKERIVDLVDVFRRNAAAGIGHLDLDAGAVPRSNAQRATGCRHGVFGIDEQVEKHLLQFPRVAM